ncbi:hypothetical protein F4703DRAFT_1824048 [Phycomyces blakesleeanus]
MEPKFYQDFLCSKHIREVKEVREVREVKELKEVCKINWVGFIFRLQMFPRFNLIKNVVLFRLIALSFFFFIYQIHFSSIFICVFIYLFSLLLSFLIRF